MMLTAGTMRLMKSIIALTLVVLAPLLTSCRGTSKFAVETSPPRPARLNHLAFFKLKNSTDARALIADCDATLAAIPGVVSYYAGRHLDTGRGERVDGNYDVGFYVGFMSEEDLAGYVTHPDHVALVNKWRERWEWIRVHDVIDETP